MIYIICFIISSSLFYISSKQKNKAVGLMIDCIALLLPCLLAGLRASSVGTDVTVYLEPMFNLAKESNTFELFMSKSWYQGWNLRGVADIEIGFSVLVYLVTKIFNNFYVLQFVIQCLTIIPIYCGLKIKKEKNLWIGMLVYFCMFYNISLNIMRQMIALSFLFLAFQYFLKRRNKLYIFYSIIAISFHNSAILGFVLPFLYKFISLRVFKKNNDFKTSQIKFIILCVCGIFLLGMQEFIISFLTYINLSNYIHYISGTITFLPNQIISRLPLLICCFIFRKALYKKEGEKFFFYCSCIIYAIIFSQFASVNDYAYRGAMVFSIFLIDIIPELCSITTYIRIGNLYKININKYFMILYLFIWWIYYSIIIVDSSIPYVLGV